MTFGTNIIQTTTIPMKEKVQRWQHLAGGAINWSKTNPPYFTKPRENFPRKDCLLAYSEQKWPAQMSPVICHHYLNYFKRNCSLYSKVEEYPNGNEFGGSRDDKFFIEKEPETRHLHYQGFYDSKGLSSGILELELLTATSQVPYKHTASRFSLHEKN